MAQKKAGNSLRGMMSNMSPSRGVEPRVRPNASLSGRAAGAASGANSVAGLVGRAAGAANASGGRNAAAANAAAAAAAIKPSSRAFGSTGATVRTPSKQPAVRQAAQSISQAYINSKPKNPRLKGR
jgi:hypothetical protein